MIYDLVNQKNGLNKVLRYLQQLDEILNWKFIIFEVKESLKKDIFYLNEK